MNAASIHVLRPGRHGGRHWSPDTLREIADSYDPGVHEAPIVLGHPKTDDPAYGWLGSLRVDDDGLHAVPSEIDPQLSELVRAGKFRKVSVALYGPASARNPKPGIWYCRHVGFLGAAPPVVKGLRPVELAELGEGDVVVELSDGAAVRTIADLFRGIRDWLIEQSSIEDADKVLPPWQIDHVQELATRDDPSTPTMAETPPMPPEDPPTADAREGDLAERERKLSEREAAAALAERRREAVQFAEEASADGRIPPRERDALADVLAAIPPDAEVELAEGGAKPAGDALRDLIGRLPKQITYGEIAPSVADVDARRPEALRVPPGFAVADTAEHDRVAAYAREHGVEYGEAAVAVGGGR